MTTFTNDSLIQDSILDCIKERAAQDFKNIQKEKTSTRCQSFAFGDLGSFGEELALYMYPNSIGSGSKGGCAFDNKEVGINMETIKAREVKCVSLDGSKECVSDMCKGHKRKAPRFQITCSYVANPILNSDMIAVAVFQQRRIWIITISYLTIS